jgi:signal transduction histidine kinase
MPLEFTEFELSSRASTAFAIVSASDIPTVVTDSTGVILGVTDPPPSGMERALPETNIRCLFDEMSRTAVQSLVEGAAESGTRGTVTLAGGESRELIVFRAGRGEEGLYLWQDARTRVDHSRLIQRGLMLASILDGFAHESRNPLHAITGFAECLVSPNASNLTANQKEYCQTILDSAKHILWLSEQLLDYSKLESGRVELELAPVDIVDLVQQADSLVRDLATRKRIQLQTDCRTEVLPTVFADGRRLLSVLSNILGNAIKYTPHGGRVDLEVLVDVSTVQFIVSDTGTGIDPSNHQRIFEPYERAVGGHGSEGGAGIGLALARKIVEMHGGEIALASEPGKGSTFVIKLPLMPRAGELTQTTEEASDSRTGACAYHWGGIV